jgi:hypothetical protein
MEVERGTGEDRNNEILIERVLKRDPTISKLNDGYEKGKNQERRSETKNGDQRGKDEGGRTDLKHPPSFLINQPRNPLNSTPSSKSSNSGFSDSPSLSAT